MNPRDESIGIIHPGSALRASFGRHAISRPEPPGPR